MTRVVVVGASLAGIAASVRLAKAGHEVILVEASTRLGGRWTPEPGMAATPLPPVIGFLAPWRDLFKKSGRPLEAELARAGLELVSAPPATHVFADGTRLTLPTDRGDQSRALAQALGASAARRWQAMLDRLDDVWQTLRHVGGVEYPFDPGRWRSRPAVLRALPSVADLSAGLDEPHLAEIVRSTAWRVGSDPVHTPGWVAVRLVLERTFGRWRLIRNGRPQPATELLDLLGERLRQRRVDVRTGVSVRLAGPGRVHTTQDAIRTDAVVLATDAWTAARLVGRRFGGTLLRVTPARAPALITRSHPASTDLGELAETITHTKAGPRVEYLRPGAAPTVLDHTQGAPDPGFGVAWRGVGTMSRLQPLRLLPGIYAASAASPAGNDPWAQILSGALATYAVHQDLTGADIHPSNRSAELGRRRPARA